jgi:hypothetical protein
LKKKPFSTTENFTCVTKTISQGANFSVNLNPFQGKQTAIHYITTISWKKKLQTIAFKFEKKIEYSRLEKVKY